MKRLVPIGVSLGILALIYWRVDFRMILDVMRSSSAWWLTISLSMAVPLSMLTTFRLQLLMPPRVRVGFGEANQLILAASVLNVVLPSKMGDIAKAYFMRERGRLDGEFALSLVVLEKGCDMLSLLLWCVLGLALYPEKNAVFGVMMAGVVLGLALGLCLLAFPKPALVLLSMGRTVAPRAVYVRLNRFISAWNSLREYFWASRVRLLRVGGISVFIWFLHLLQIWLFILALRGSVPFLVNLALAPLAILAGLLPLTFAGVGTRDAAIIALYQPFLNAHTAAALGILHTSRYLLPAIAGLPFLRQYLASVQRPEERPSAGHQGTC